MALCSCLLGFGLVVPSCAAPKQPPVPTAAEIGLTPRVRSPRGTLYVHGSRPPIDPLVAQVLGGKAWDEVLSGAAVGVALEALSGAPLDAALARWRAVVAGYPYPITAVASESVPVDTLPHRLMAALPELEGDLGLVRVRGMDGDLWVLLLGRSRAELPPVPREVSLGQSVDLAGHCSWTVGDPNGGFRTLSGKFEPDQRGEWLLQARRGDEVVATLPIYVGEGTPEGQPIPPNTDARGALQELRGWYGLPELGDEPLLDGIARARLRAAVEGLPNPAVSDQLRAAGFDGVGASGGCKAATVQDCLYALWWDPEDRAVLVGASIGIGIASVESEGQVRLMLVSAG